MESISKEELWSLARILRRQNTQLSKRCRLLEYQTNIDATKEVSILQSDNTKLRHLLQFAEAASRSQDLQLRVLLPKLEEAKQRSAVLETQLDHAHASIKALEKKVKQQDRVKDSSKEIRDLEDVLRASIDMGRLKSKRIRLLEEELHELVENQRTYAENFCRCAKSEDLRANSDPKPNLEMISRLEQKVHDLNSKLAAADKYLDIKDAVLRDLQAKNAILQRQPSAIQELKERHDSICKNDGNNLELIDVLAKQIHDKDAQIRRLTRDHPTQFDHSTKSIASNASMEGVSLDSVYARLKEALAQLRVSQEQSAFLQQEVKRLDAALEKRKVAS